MPPRVIVAMLLVFVPMLGENALSRRNERRLRANGAIEAAGDVYALMAIVYPTAFLAMAIEGWWWSRPMDAWFVAGVCTWAISKVLKYWAIATLGQRWSFRVLVHTGAPLVNSGPYRFAKHPNYVALGGEFVAAAMLCPAPVLGLFSAIVFGMLLRRRIRVEERALGLVSD